MWFVIAVICSLFLLQGLFKAPRRRFRLRSPDSRPSSDRPFSPHSQPSPHSQRQKPDSIAAFRSKKKLPDNLVVTEEFQKAFDLIEKTNSCAYITGKAGTGKSTLLTWFRQNTRKNCVVLAPTGIAAITVEGATINSFFGFPPRLIQKSSIRMDENRRPLFQHLEMIVIDEISMVSPAVMDNIDYSLRLHRQSTRPFGGVQLIFFGDLYQLPPVITIDQAAYFEAQFGGIYFFNARVFSEIKLAYLELQTIFRQKDERFKQALNNIRDNTVTAEDLDLINSRCQPHPDHDSSLPLTLTTTNKIADLISEAKMCELSGKEYIFPAQTQGVLDRSACPADLRLALKLGARVILLKNDPQKRWVNGSMGTVSKISDSGISVEINGSVYPLDRVTWEMIGYRYHTGANNIESMVVGSFSQFPVKAAWAITIHKSQGLTLERIIVDLGARAFAHGQTYVALSRCTTLEGLILSRPISRRDIILDPKVRNFIRSQTPMIP
jgi:ATP-dependent DNA helicase PIF1